MIDSYCERSGPGWYAEPLNTTTNLVFLIAAIAAWRLARRLGVTSPGIAVLVILAVAIGIGSAVYHAVGAPWAMVLDLLPIFIFQLVFLGLYLREGAGVSATGSAALVLGFFAICAAVMAMPPYLNGSVIYVPALIALVVLGAFHSRRGLPGRWHLVAAAAVFFAALSFRTIEPAVCPHFPPGTHFLWHLLNGAVVFLAMRTLIVMKAALPAPRQG